MTHGAILLTVVIGLNSLLAAVPDLHRPLRSYCAMGAELSKREILRAPSSYSQP